MDERLILKSILFVSIKTSCFSACVIDGLHIKQPQLYAFINKAYVLPFTILNILENRVECSEQLMI